MTRQLILAVTHSAGNINHTRSASNYLRCTSLLVFKVVFSFAQKLGFDVSFKLWSI